MSGFRYKLVLLCVLFFFSFLVGEAYGQLKLTSEKNFYACGSQGKYTLEVKQASTGTYSDYRIEWGDGKSNEYTGQKTMNHDYVQPGSYSLKFYGKSADGWGTPVEYLVTAENTEIRLTLEGATTGTQCKGTEINLVLRDLRDNSVSTIYEVDYGDNSGLITYTSKDLTDERDVLKLRHIYNEPSCGEEGSGYMISLRAQNTCGGISTPKYGPYRVAEQLKVRFDLPEKLCTENELDLDGITSVEPTACGNMDIRKTWMCDGEEVADGYVYFDKVGVYTFTASAIMDGLDCGNDKIVKSIRIIERVKAAVTPEQGEICVGSLLMLDASGSAGDEKKYRWSVLSGKVSAVKFLPDVQAERVSAEFAEPGDYIINVLVYNDCSSDEKTVRVHVKKEPEVRKLKEINPRCPEGSKWGTGVVNMAGIVDYVWYNNQPNARWTLKGPAGGWYEAPMSHDPLKPIYVFTKPGQYEIRVDIESAGCGGMAEQLSQTWTVTINDPAIAPDIVVADGKTDLCEGGEVRFRNNTTAGHAAALRFEWTVKKNGGAAREGVDYQFTGSTNAHSKEPVLKFLTYGDYTVEVLAAVECNGENREFHFHVKKAPEIVHFEIPQVECTPYVLLLRRMVEYNWFNDAKKQLTWTVEGDAGGWEYLSGTNEHSLLPEMKFNIPGEYRVKVTLDGVGCSDGAEASQTLKILNPSLDKDIKLKGQGVICEGETVSFENRTHSDIPIEYNWVVEADNGATEGNGYFFAAGANATAAEPQITFTRFGNYTVIARLTTDCNRGRPTEERFNVTVQRDPEVYIAALESICPDEDLVMDASKVTYHWNNNVEEVEWVIEPATSATTGNAVYEPNALYPQIHFTHPGDYRIQAYLLNRAGCNGTALMAERIVHVYDPAMQLTITPSSQMVQEGDVFHFTNHSQAAEPPGYLWSVVPAGGWEWVGKNTDAAPDIRFTRFGQYTVKVVMTSKGGCVTDFCEMTVEVKGVPEYRLPAELDAICAGSTINMQEKLSYDAKGATIKPQWTVTPGVENVDYEYVTSGGASVIQPEIRFLKNGRYTLTLKADAEYGGTQVHVTHVNVLTPSVKALTLSDFRGCTKPGSPLDIELINRSVGDTLSYAWRVEPATGYGFVAGSAESRQPTLRITEKGDYQVTLRVENICDSDEAEFHIHAFTNPEIDPIKDIRDECDKFYVFRSKDVVKVDSNGGRLEWAKWTIEPAGYTYETGFGASDLYTEVRFKGGNTPYRMKLEVRNGCGDVIAQSFSVLVDEFREIVPLRDTALCSLSGDYPLKAEPAGGEWTCSGHVLGKNEWTGEYYFTPEEETETTYRLYYTYGHKSCTASDSLDLTVYPLPAVQVEKDKEDACINWAVKTLQPGMPAGGEWKLNNVLITEFDPAVYGVGIHRLEYWYTDPLTQCANLDTLKIEVHGLPDASFRVADKQCRGIDSLYVPNELGKGHHFEWDFSTGTQVTEDKPAVWKYATVGEYKVTLQATSVYQCQSVPFSRTVKVLDLPPMAEFVLKDTAGCGPFPTQAEVDAGDFVHPEGDYYELRYLWEYGNGNSSTDLQPLKQTYAPTLYDTTYQLFFQVYNVCGMERDSADVGVWSSAVAHFSMNPDPESARGFCTPVTPVFINASTGSGAVYTWDFSGMGISHARDTVYTFTTGVSPSVFTVTLKAANRCNPDGSEASRTFKVKPNPIIAGFTMDEKYLCAGDTVCFTNNSVDRDEDAGAILSYKWDFGDGQVNDVWDTCHHYPVAGIYPVTLSLDNGCARQSFTDSVVIYAVPELTIEGDSTLCEDGGLAFVLTTSEPLKNILWDFGDGTLTEQGAFAVEHVFEEPGHFVVQVTANADQIAGCMGKGEKNVEIWPKPRVTIAPLDTMVCPVYHYMPEIDRTGYDYFTWDYGDGSPLTSELSHEFVNETDEIAVYRTSVHVVNNYGCEEDHQGVIRVYPGPTAGWDKEIAYGRPEKVRFINLSEDYTDCYWYLPFGEVVNSPDDQAVEFPDEGIYPVALVAVNEYGCRDSIFEDYRSYEGGLYFPNAFIPHSKNPRVNCFNGVGMGLKAYKLEIFDTYGNKIWETTALEGGVPSEGWNGCNGQGKELPQGVYIWRAEAIFFSEDIWTGKNNRSGVTQTTQGTVLLLRE